jgi:hypothetical protein
MPHRPALLSAFHHIAAPLGAYTHLLACRTPWLRLRQPLRQSRAQRCVRSCCPTGTTGRTTQRRTRWRTRATWLAACRTRRPCPPRGRLVVVLCAAWKRATAIVSLRRGWACLRARRTCATGRAWCPALLARCGRARASRCSCTSRQNTQRSRPGQGSLRASSTTTCTRPAQSAPTSPRATAAPPHPGSRPSL